MTNYEKIMSKMTVEELAEFMAVCFDGCNGCPLEASGCCIYRSFCKDNIKNWLESEASPNNVSESL